MIYVIFETFGGKDGFDKWFWDNLLVIWEGEVDPYFKLNRKLNTKLEKNGKLCIPLVKNIFIY